VEAGFLKLRSERPEPGLVTPLAYAYAKTQIKRNSFESTKQIRAFSVVGPQPGTAILLNFAFLTGVTKQCSGH